MNKLSLLLLLSALSVHAQSAITTQPQPQTVAVGGTATFTAAVSGGPCHSGWYQNGSEHFGAYASTFTYSIPNVTQSMNGTTIQLTVWGCSAGGPELYSNTVTLTVSSSPVPPTITTQPANQTVTVGQTATFTVVASGTPPLSYQWENGGANISGATSASYTTPPTVSTDNGSSFTVTVTNSAGSVLSSTAFLTVNQSQNSVSVSPTSLTFTAQAVGTVAAPQWVTLTNNGTTAVTLGTVTIGMMPPNQPYFGLFPNPAILKPIAPGGTTSFLIIFIPQSAGTFNVSLIIPIQGGTAVTVPITGTGQ